MQAAYSPRNPIQEYWRREISLRQLRVLIEGLPADNAVSRAVNGSHWRDVEWLLNDISRQLRVSNAMYFNAHRDVKKTRPVEPEFLPTPETGTSLQDQHEEDALAAQQRSEMDAIWERIDPDRH